jgi:signal transduction histidine kinase
MGIVTNRKAVHIEISDTGIGIPPEDLGRVYEEFFRASNNLDTKGSGLGLSIAKRVIEAHDGKIWVESPHPDTGKGCRFTITMPRKRKRE